jgi:hypothetical protein
VNLFVKLSLALALFWVSEAGAQEGQFGHGHDMWHQGFYQTLHAQILKVRAAILPIVALPQEDRSVIITR